MPWAGKQKRWVWKYCLLLFVTIWGCLIIHVSKYQLKQERVSRLNSYCSGYYEHVWVKICIEMLSPGSELLKCHMMKQAAKINLLLHIIMFHLPTLTVFVICAFSLHKGFATTLIALLLFYPRYIFHKHLLIAVFITRKTWASQPFCIHFVGIFTFV